MASPRRAVAAATAEPVAGTDAGAKDQLTVAEERKERPSAFFRRCPFFSRTFIMVMTVV